MLKINQNYFRTLNLKDFNFEITGLKLFEITCNEMIGKQQPLKL